MCSFISVFLSFWRNWNENKVHERSLDNFMFLFILWLRTFNCVLHKIGRKCCVVVGAYLPCYWAESYRPIVVRKRFHIKMNGFRLGSFSFFSCHGLVQFLWVRIMCGGHLHHYATMWNLFEDIKNCTKFNQHKYGVLCAVLEWQATWFHCCSFGRSHVIENPIESGGKRHL